MKDDYEVIWAGVGPLPGIRSEGWVQKENVLLRGAHASKSFLTRKEMAGAKHVVPADTGIGTRCHIEPIAKGHCRGCARLWPARQLTKKLRLCPECRPGRQRAVRLAA